MIIINAKWPVLSTTVRRRVLDEYFSSDVGDIRSIRLIGGSLAGGHQTHSRFLETNIKNGLEYYFIFQGNLCVLTKAVGQISYNFTAGCCPVAEALMIELWELSLIHI